MKKRLLFVLIVSIMTTIFPATSLAENPTKPVLYNAVITTRYAKSTTFVYDEMDIESEKITSYKPKKRVQVVNVYPNWVEINLESGTGYVLRHRVDAFRSVDPKTIPPFGVEKYTYYTVISQDTNVLDAPSEKGEVLSSLTKGAKIAFIGVENGWAKLIYHRQYAWVDTRKLDSLYPIQNDPNTATTQWPLAAFTSFYNTIPNRIVNLKICCERMTRVMQVGERLDFNGQVGPFKKALGYLPAPIISKTADNGYGGGSCQVSSSLHNTVLQLPGITVVTRWPHGNNGASYLPHGTDASSGALNYVIENNYPFPIRIEASCHDYALYVAIYKADVE